jgi:predicted amidophosphoribosyltransferase
MLAHELTLPCETLLRRKPMTKQQKSLGAAEREKNASASFELEQKVSLANRTVVLIDDVCTTGASLATCANLLHKAGASRVICAVVARTGKDKK